MKRSESNIVSKRLWLRQIDETDAEVITQIRSDETIYQYFLNPVKLTKEEHNRWYKEHYCCDNNRIDWIAVNDEDGTFVGVYGAKKIDDVRAEISYITAPEQKHGGYASEAVTSIIEWCRHHWKTKEFIATVHKENLGSVIFAEKNGFRKYSQDGNFLIMQRE